MESGNIMQRSRNRKQPMPEKLSSEMLDAIESRYVAATAGPWISFVEGRDGNWGFDSFIRTGGEDIYLRGATMADQDFIAHAHQDVPLLIAEIRALRSGTSN
jgi:hypothetical protein